MNSYTSELPNRSLDAVFEQTSPLLTSELEARRLGAPVVLHSVKGDPRKPPGNPSRYIDSLGEKGEVEAVRLTMLNPYNIHAVREGPGHLALIRKTSPHGKNDMTVIAQEGYDDGPVVSLFDFPRDIRQSFYGIGADFSRCAEQNGLYPVVSFSYDPLTKDRDTVQSVKTFHMHLTARDTDELTQMRSKAHPLGEHSVMERRQLIDESSIVYSLALYDYFTAHPVDGMEPVSPFSEDSCSNIRFRIGDNWTDILTNKFDQGIRTIHEGMSALYTDFSEATMTGELGLWVRPFFSIADANAYVEDLEWMQPETKEIFNHYISGLRPRHLMKGARLEKLGLGRHVYPLAGLCYATAISRNARGELMLSIRPQQFADDGSTGLQYIDPVGAQVRMNRGLGKYDEGELASKQAFEREYAAYIVGKSGATVNL